MQTLFLGASLAAGLMLVAGCGNKTEETATPPAATSANVPAEGAQAAQGAQQMGSQQGQNAAANAAAWKAAREKAEGK